MDRLIVNHMPIKIIFIASTFLIIGCATSMTPSEFNVSFPEATTSKFYDRTLASEAISSGRCKLLVKDRKYTAPIGFTVEGDVNNGAEGVDQWVEADQGNAYAINNFEWISVGDQGSTQLLIYFDTMLCE